jgi:hypothetical protein
MWIISAVGLQVLDSGANPDGPAPISDVRTCSRPLLFIVRSDPMRQLLLDSGADLNIVGLDYGTKSGETSLVMVIAHKNKSLERFLLAHGWKFVAELSNSEKPCSISAERTTAAEPSLVTNALEAKGRLPCY